MNFSLVFLGFNMTLSVVRTIENLIKKKQLSQIRSLLDAFSFQQRKDIVCEKIKKKSLLYIAIEHKENAIVKFLINECGANVKEAGSCLSIAAYNHSFELVKMLVKNGSDINSVTDVEEKSALYYACHNGNMAHVEYLVENGAHIDQPDIEGNTPLMVSVKCPNICRYLLMNGADPNHVNVYGKTALMLAAGQEEVPYCVLILLMYQANAKFTNEFGENAVFIAAEKGYEETLQYLQLYEADIMNSSARSYQMISCFAAIENYEYKSKLYWTMSMRILEIPIETSIFHLDQLSLPHSNLKPILKIVNSSWRKAILYLVEIFGLNNPYTLKAIGNIVLNTRNMHECVELYSFFLTTLMSTSNVTFFRMFPWIHIMCKRILIHYNTNNTLEIVEEIFQNFQHLGDDLLARFRLLSKKEKVFKSITIDSYFSSIIMLTGFVYKWKSGKHTAFNKILEKILSLNLRGTKNNSLLHYNIIHGYPVDLCKTLLLCKADVNCENQEGLTPVHYIIHSPQYLQTETIEMFLTYDFQLNEWKDETFCLACKLKKLRICPQPVKNTWLQCLAAKVVSENEFRYDEKVPRHLKNLVYSHF